MNSRFFWIFLVLLQFLIATNSYAFSNLSQVPDSIIIKYKSKKRFVNHGESMQHIRLDIEVVRHTDSISASSSGRLQRYLKKIAQIQKDNNVLYAEPNYTGHFDSTVMPTGSDPQNPRQWWLSAVSDKALLALGRGAGVIVAVIDTGVDLGHPDLTPNLLPDGYNFGDGNNIPQDVLGHGTMVAGIIAASGKNSNFNIESLAPEAKILPIKINPGGEDVFTSAHLATAIEYAVSHKAKVINLSLSVENQTQTVRDSIQNALNQGIMVVSSAGNGNRPVDFPANMPGVVGVAAVDKLNQLASFSNSGPEITVAAPGVDIFTTTLGQGYGSGSGTSLSAPIVSAAIAGLMSINMTLPGSTLTQYLRNRASAISGGTYSFGSLNAGASGSSMVPHLLLNKERFTRFDRVEVNYELPQTGAAVQIYVSVNTPFGEFSLLPNGYWERVVDGRYKPIAQNYESEKPVNGLLFGGDGLFSSISTFEFPTGAYVWRTAVVSQASGQLIGGITESTIHLD